ncbi:MAG TPA: Crp/Fnr family transcriptional regulator [Myxococcota bacterium]|nr:Crp/Fnr family transcriptional regulator [Myxococcota bacterium]
MGELSELLHKVTIFEALDAEALTRLETTLKPLEVGRDQVIVGQSDPGDALFIIDRGRVKVTLQGENNREVILSIFKAGDFFGEMSLLDGQPRSATVVAIEDAHLWRLDREAFVQHLTAHPTTALKVLEVMCNRLRRADDVIGNLALLDVYSRVARVLIDLGQREGESTEEGIMIRERPTQQELASMIGTSRETVSRALSELQRQGYLSMQGKAVLLSHAFAARDPQAD